MRLFGHHYDSNVLYAPVSGRLVSLDDVPDEVFSERILGDGVAIEPEGERIVSPVDGIVTMTMSSGHAIGLRTDFGAEILIHIGVNTVCLNGRGFRNCVRQGTRVRIGQKLIEFDRELICAQGYPCTTMVLLINGEQFEFRCTADGYIETEERLLELYGKSL